MVPVVDEALGDVERLDAGLLLEPLVAHDDLVRARLVERGRVPLADTRANDPGARVKEVAHWLATGDPAIPRRYGATWAVTKDGRLIHLRS